MNNYGTYILPPDASHSMVKQLISADTPAKLDKRVKEWYPFTFKKLAPWLEAENYPSLEEESLSVVDARELILLALKIKNLIDDNQCNKEAFERLGARIYQGEATRCEIHYSFQSPTLKNRYLRKDEHELTIASNVAQGEFDSRDTIHAKPFSKEQAYSLLDDLMCKFLSSAKIKTNNGLLVVETPSKFVSLWFYLSDSFRDSRITICPVCEKPIIVDDERGTSRIYCDGSCKKQGRRARDFRDYINSGYDEKDAGKKAAISVNKAKRILKNLESISLKQ